MVKAQFSQKTVLLSLVGLACACIIVSLLGFRLKWGVWPGPGDLVMGLTLLAPFALPKGFADTLGLTNPHSTRGIIPALILFWPITGGLIWYTVKSRRAVAFILLALLGLTASLNWQVVANGLIGL